MPISQVLNSRLVIFSRCLVLGLMLGLVLGLMPSLLVGEEGGPLTKADFIALLDANNPAVAEIRRLGTGDKGDNGDVEAAGKAFVSYLRSRKAAVLDNRLEFNAKRADDAVAGRIGGKTYPDGKINWHENRTEIVRTEMWSDFAAGYRKGKTSYADAFERQFRQWRQQMPLPKTKPAQGALNTLNVGVRLGRSWTDAYQVFTKASQVHDDVLLEMTISMCEQARYLVKNHSLGTNWLVNEMLGLYSVGALLPELSPAPAWRKLALEMLDKNVAKELLPDGAWSELAPGYGNWNSNNIMRVLDRARDAGFANELPTTLSNRIDKSYAWIFGLMTPDGRIPRLNDCTSWMKCDSRLARSLLKSFPENPILIWAAKNRLGTAPPASVFLPESGFILMRTGWEADATYVLFDVGPMGSSWHAHQDKLQVVLWSGSRELLMDNGGGPYDENPRRIWSRASDSHNTIMVDGCGQARWRNRGRDGDEENELSVDLVPGDPATPTPLFATTPTWDYGCGWYVDAYMRSGRGDGAERGPRPASHRREVALVKPDIIVVVDTLESLDSKPHVYESRWNLPTIGRRLDPTSDSIVTTWDKGPNLAIIPMVRDGLVVKHDSGVLKPEVLGWNYDNNRWLPALTIRHTAPAANSQRFVTLFKVLKTGENAEAITVTSKSEETYEAAIANGSTVTVKLGRGGKPGMSISIAGDPAGEKSYDIEVPKKMK